MTYRVAEIQWHPRNKEAWDTFTACRKEAAILWNRMARIHFYCRKHQMKWPTRKQYRKWATRMKFPNLCSASVQEAIDEFLEAVEGTRVKRKNGDQNAKYPVHRQIGQEGYRSVTYTNCAARFSEVVINSNDQSDKKIVLLILPNGGSGTLAIRLPRGTMAVCGKTLDGGKKRNDWTVSFSDGANPYLKGRFMEAQLGYGIVRLVIKTDEELIRTEIKPTIGVDLGVNTLIAATDGHKAVLVSGRQVKSVVQYRNKTLAEIDSVLSKTKSGSRKSRALQRRKRKLLQSTHNKIKNAIHKATRLIADEFPEANAYVGKPFNDAARKMRKKHAQQVGQSCNRKIITTLGYKLGSVEELEEHYTSQTCPQCGKRSKHKRTYKCKCGCESPRDVVGSLNILTKGKSGEIQSGTPIPDDVKYLRPL